MTNSYLCAYESKETFTTLQIDEITDAINKAVEKAISSQCSRLAECHEEPAIDCPVGKKAEFEY